MRERFFNGYKLADIMRLDLKELSGKVLKEAVSRITSAVNKRLKRTGSDQKLSIRGLNDDQIRAVGIVGKELSKERNTLKKTAHTQSPEEKAESLRKEIDKIRETNPHRLTANEFRKQAESLFIKYNELVDIEESLLPDELRTKKLELTGDMKKDRSSWYTAVGYEGNKKIASLEKSWNTLVSNGSLSGTAKPTVGDLKKLARAFQLYDEIKKISPDEFLFDYKYDITEEIVIQLNANDDIDKIIDNLEEIKERAIKRNQESGGSLDEFFSRWS